METTTELLAPSIISIRSDWDILVARMAARDAARRLGFGAIDQARIATATSEMARHIIVHMGEGQVTIGPVQHNNRYGIEIVFQERNTGVPDVRALLLDDVQPNGSKGLGMAASRRLMDDVDIAAGLADSTTITCRKWLR